MIKEDTTKKIVIVPVCGLEFSKKTFGGGLTSINSFGHIISGLIDSPSFTDCSYFTEVIASPELSKKYIKEYYDAFKKCNNITNIYKEGGVITTPLNQMTKDVINKEVNR